MSVVQLEDLPRDVEDLILQYTSEFNKRIEKLMDERYNWVCYQNTIITCHSDIFSRQEKRIEIEFANYQIALIDEELDELK